MKQIFVFFLTVVIGMVNGKIVFAQAGQVFDTRKSDWEQNVILWEKESQEDGLELLFTSLDNRKGNTQAFKEQEAEQIKQMVRPMEEIAYQDMSIEGTENLHIMADLCGIVVEASKDQRLHLIFTDMEEAGAPSISIQKDTNGNLTIFAAGKEERITYLQASKEKIVNMLRIQVPEEQLSKITLQANTGMFLFSKISIPISVTMVKGKLAVCTEKTTQTEIHTIYGDVLVQADRVLEEITIGTRFGKTQCQIETGAYQMDYEKKDTFEETMEELEKKIVLSVPE